MRSSTSWHAIKKNRRDVLNAQFCFYTVIFKRGLANFGAVPGIEAEIGRAAVGVC